MISKRLARPVRLYHPRNDVWAEHFTHEAVRIAGRTPIGRATVQVLSMNAYDLLLIRVEPGKEGLLPQGTSDA